MRVQFLLCRPVTTVLTQKDSESRVQQIPEYEKLKILKQMFSILCVRKYLCKGPTDFLHVRPETYYSMRSCLLEAIIFYHAE